MKSPNQNIRVWRQNGSFFQYIEGSVGELAERSHLWLLLCLLYCLELVGWWSFPKREAELKIASDRSYWLVGCCFFFCTANKKTLLVHLWNGFLLVNYTWKIQKGNRENVVCFVLLLGNKSIDKIWDSYLCFLIQKVKSKSTNIFKWQEKILFRKIHTKHVLYLVLRMSIYIKNIKMQIYFMLNFQCLDMNFVFDSSPMIYDFTFPRLLSTSN